MLLKSLLWPNTAEVGKGHIQWYGAHRPRSCLSRHLSGRAGGSRGQALHSADSRWTPNVHHAGPVVPPSGTQELFTKFGTEPKLELSSSGGGAFGTTTQTIYAYKNQWVVDHQGGIHLGNSNPAVPEPGTLGLLATGLIGMAGSIRRKFLG